MEKLTPNAHHENRTEQQKLPTREKAAPKPEKSSLSASKSAAAIRDGASIRALAPTQVLELAELAGNSRLLELFKGGGDGPELFSFSRPGDAGEEECNLIHTEKPRLSEPPPFTMEGALPRGTFDPGNLRDRNDANAKYPDLFWNAPEEQ